MKKERCKRLIIFLEVMVLIGIMTGMYAYLWSTYYEGSVLIPFFRRGNVAMVWIYPIMLLIFGKLFGIFNAAVATRVDMVFSNVFNALITDTIIYFVLVALLRHYIDIKPLLLLFIAEAAISVIWVLAVKAVNNVIFPPHRLLLIHGDYSLKDLVIDVNERSERYTITEEVNVNRGMDVIRSKIEQHDAVLISDLPAETRNDILKYCYDIDKRIYTLPKITDIIIAGSAQIHLFDNVAYISKNYGLTADQRLIKRVFDIVVSSVMIICLSWLMGIIAIAIKAGDGGKVFYRQKRLTIDGKVFDIIKFRSMREDAESEGPQLATKNDNRVTKVGAVLRAAHLDELPQLFNVFKGDMSMVGPRPERPEIAWEYTQNVPEFNFRLKTKAGLTGYAQVYGRYNSTPYNKLRLDLTYIHNYSIWLDIKCMVMTVKILFKSEAREGVEEGQKTAEKNNDI
ncbi:MAG: exopolysaccharide biosynthesis polyprenyl glycosylphosphotransferase [Parasporobacterium sp.]|nr:exopolysaccharide biosynthesis polyprenyl glycosylphosphotransferase [Parasporobacterium sp.]